MKYSVDKSQQQVVVVTCSNANQKCVLRWGKQPFAEDGSELSVLSISQFFSVLFKRYSDEFWNNKIKFHHRIILALGENSEMEQGEKKKKPNQHIKTLTNSETNL